MEMKWISVKDKPIPMLKTVIAGLRVNHKPSGNTWFEKHVISIDEEGSVFDINCDYFSSWNVEDFEYWYPLNIPDDIE